MPTPNFQRATLLGISMGLMCESSLSWGGKGGLEDSVLLGVGIVSGEEMQSTRSS